MDEKQYWTFIHSSLVETNTVKEQFFWIREQLFNLDLISILDFNVLTRKLLLDLFEYEVWAAAFAALNGCWEERFCFFCGWIIGQGKDFFNLIQKAPDRLYKRMNADKIPINERLFHYHLELDIVAKPAYCSKFPLKEESQREDEFYTRTEQEINKRYNRDDQRYEFPWNICDLAKMRRTVPKLYDEYLDEQLWKKELKLYCSEVICP